MPATFPGYTPWEFCDGDFTLSADRETLTLPASPTTALRTGWIDTGGTLVNAQRSGTATGTLLGRTSAALPTSRDDSALILPGSAEWTKSYDAAGNQTPAVHSGWSTSGSPTTDVTGGEARVTTSGSTGWWQFNPYSLPTGDLMLVYARFKPAAAHQSLQGIGPYLPYAANNAFRLHWTGSDYGANANKVLNELTGVYVPNLTITSDAYNDLVLLVRSSGGVIVQSDLLHRLSGSYDLLSTEGFTNYGTVAGTTSAFNLLAWGSFTSAGANITDTYWQFFGALSVSAEWESIANPDTSFARNQQYWQFKGGTLADGTLTGLDLMGSTSAPSDVSGLAVAAVGSIALAGAHTAVAGAAAYYHEVLDADNADAVVTAHYDYEPGSAPPVPATGNYKYRARAVTDDGVKSSAATTSAATPVPAVTPTVALTITPDSIGQGEVATASWTVAGIVTATLNDDPITGTDSAEVVTWDPPPPVTINFVLSQAEVAPGETSEATAEVTGSATLTFDDVAWDGTSQVAVTGIPSPGSAPPGAISLRQQSPPGAVRIKPMPASEFAVSEVTAGSAALDVVRLLTAATLADAPELDDTQDTNPVDYADLTFDDDGWSTNLDWVRGEGWYWVEAVDVDGRVTRSLPIWGGEQADVEVTLGGQLASQWDGKAVKVTLIAVAIEGGQAYLTKTYEGVVGATVSGQWEITRLPIGGSILLQYPDMSPAIAYTLPADPGGVDVSDLA